MYQLIRLTLLVSAFLAGAVSSVAGGPTYNFANRHSLIGAPHIVGGVDISIEKVPFQTSIETFRFHSCGGVIISDIYVLTAAHCGFFSTPYNNSITAFISRIHVGSTTAIPLFGWGGNIHDISWHMSHPKWKMDIVDYDVSIIKVTKPFAWSLRIQPARIPQYGLSEEAFIQYDQNATVSGWGLTKTDGWFTPWFLKAVQIKLMPREECNKKMSSVEDIGDWKFTSRMLCGSSNGKGGVCMGDSGGPMIHRDHVIGISSFVFRSCNDPEYPSGFANLFDSEIRHFIKEVANV